MYSKEEAKQLKIDFWDGFGRYSKRLKHIKQQNKKWILYNTGIKHLELKFELQQKLLRVMIEVNHRSENQRLDIFAQLEKYKPIIEEIFGDGLIWDFLYTTETEKEVCRVYVETTEFNFNRQSDWPLMYTYMAQNMIKMELAFMEIKDFIEVPESF